MRTSEKIDELATALAKAQGMIGHAEKDSRNPHFNSTFASLSSCIDAIKKPFADNGLSFTQPISRNGNEVVCTTRLMHTSGQWIEEAVSATPQQNTPQGLGSCATYLKRYQICAVAGISPDEDDDGHVASFKEKAKAAPPPKKEPAGVKLEKLPEPQKAKEPKEPDWAKGPYTGTEMQMKYLNKIFQHHGLEDEKLMEEISELMKTHQIEVKNLPAGVKECLELNSKGALNEYA